jgi:YesN/AraC family two-component response regulator
VECCAIVENGNMSGRILIRGSGTAKMKPRRNVSVISVLIDQGRRKKLGESSTSAHGNVVVIIAEKAFHDLYTSLPLKTATAHYCVPVSAHDQIKRLQPAVILLDGGLKVEKSLRMLKELKEFHPHVPIIFLAHGKSYDTVTKAYRAGARDFVEKPPNLFDLRDTVESILRIRKDCKEARSPLAVARSSDKEFLKAVTPDKPATILRAIQYIEDNLSNKINLDLLAREAHLSKYHFSRIFYRHMKMTPVQFVMRMRIEAAKELLKVNNGRNISHVGEQVGFNNFSSFVRQFKSITGKTPSNYKKSLKES